MTVASAARLRPDHPLLHPLQAGASRTLATPRAAFWLAQFGGWTAYGLSTFLTLLASLPAGQRWAYLLAKLLRAAVGFGASLLLRELYRALRTRRASTGATLAAAAVGCISLGAAWLVIYRVGIAPALLTTPPPWGWDVFPRAALDLTFVLAAWSGVYFGVLQWQAAQHEARRALEAERLAQDARFMVLSAQLNPHFLFNALNSIRALIREDGRRAEEMVTELAGFLRYSLAHEPIRPATAADEIEAARHYLAIEAIRFEHRLSVATEVAPEVAACAVPSFLLLPLVENAVKYGARGEDGVLRISVAAHEVGGRLRIAVRNTGRLDRADAPPRGTGLGWRAVRERLAHVHPSEHTFAVTEAAGWVEATIDLPMRARLEPAVAHA